MAQKPAKIDEDQYENMRKIWIKKGIPIAEQIRRAVSKWLDEANKDDKED